MFKTIVLGFAEQLGQAKDNSHKYRELGEQCAVNRFMTRLVLEFGFNRRNFSGEPPVVIEYLVESSLNFQCKIAKTICKFAKTIVKFAMTIVQSLQPIQGLRFMILIHAFEFFEVSLEDIGQFFQFWRRSIRSKIVQRLSRRLYHLYPPNIPCPEAFRGEG